MQADANLQWALHERVPGRQGAVVVSDGAGVTRLCRALDRTEGLLIEVASTMICGGGRG
jgi:hypothetical protein